MSEKRPPARPWYNLVMEEIAIRGMSVAELARRANVTRPTIYGWQDNPSKPQPRSVNSVADVLDIDRRKAVRLAGIVAAGQSDGFSGMPAELRESVRRTLPADRAARVEAAIEAALAGEPLPTTEREARESEAS